MKTAMLLVACLSASLAFANEVDGGYQRADAGLMSRKMLDFKTEKFCDPGDKVKTCTGSNEYCKKLDYPKCVTEKKCDDVCVKYDYKYEGSGYSKKKVKFCAKYEKKCYDKKVCYKYACATKKIVVKKPAPKVVMKKPAPKVVVVKKPAPKVVVVKKPAPKVVVAKKPAPKVVVVKKFG